MNFSRIITDIKIKQTYKNAKRSMMISSKWLLFRTRENMKAAFILLAIALPAAYCFYLQPNVHYMPARVNSRSAPVYKRLGDMFHRLHLASRRCVNTFDESCINDNINGAASDEGFLNGGSGPGKRCVNTFDESCANGDIDGAGTDDDWLNGGDTPGRR